MKEPRVLIRCLRVSGRSRNLVAERVAVEHQIDIYVNGTLERSLVCSPGSDELLIRGHLLSEGLISTNAEVLDIRRSNDQYHVQLSGTSDIDRDSPSALAVRPSDIMKTVHDMMENQEHHKVTGAFHAAILRELGTEKSFSCEDISRHCVVDKVIGYGAVNDFDLSRSLLITSGRLTSSIVSKAVRCHIPILGSLTVATERGVLLAKTNNLTLVGALTRADYWLYHEGSTRIVTSER
ncbi:MAG: formate dehydrogenase accessory sulfurtransferase FdhD [Candidatus Thorarchaeota archaeon]|nr:MAG: hypothetical protein DRP09_06870 [Candidatus Thorarchaeota archaeon]RLI58804.1 MAG: hypothetical protein DRO87_04685 [Candidatus Thorarchaeota archaeon]